MLTAKNRVLFPLKAIALLSPLIWSGGAIAVENCQYGIYSAAPSAAVRTIHGDGFSFDIPANYRTELQAGGVIAVIDPDMFQHMACTRRSLFPDDYSYYLTVQPINARVQEGRWPYDLPGFEWFEDIHGMRYGETSGQTFALFSYYSVYNDTDVENAVENMPAGGSVFIQAPIFSDYSHDVLSTVFSTLKAN